MQFVYEDKDLDRIIKYCEQDVITVAQIILGLRNEELLREDEINSWCLKIKLLEIRRL